MQNDNIFVSLCCCCCCCCVIATETAKYEKEIKHLKCENAKIDWDIKQMTKEKDYYCGVIDSIKNILEKSMSDFETSDYTSENSGTTSSNSSSSVLLSKLQNTIQAKGLN